MNLPDRLPPLTDPYITPHKVADSPTFLYTTARA